MHIPGAALGGVRDGCRRGVGDEVQPGHHDEVVPAEVLDADAFDAYEQSGDLFNSDLAGKFRKYILAEGGWDEPMTQYVRFRGQEPTETPLLRNRGLL